MGKQVRVIDALSNATTTTYDGMRREWVEDAKGNRRYFYYDALGRVIKTQLPATDDNPVTYVHVGYDGLGRKAWESIQTSKSDPDDLDDDTEKKWYGYDISGRLTSVTLPEVTNPYTDEEENPVYRYFYDTYGNQVGILDPNERLTVFCYNEMNQQAAKFMPFMVDAETISDADDVYSALNAQSPRPGEQSMTYDDYGRVITATDYKGQVTGYFYNSWGQLQEKKYYNNDADYPDSPAQTTSYTYDDLGRKKTVTDTRGVTKYYYDAEGRIVKEVTPEGAINYEYNSITGRKARTWTAKTETWYYYDELGRLKETWLTKRDGDEIDPAEVTTYSYDDVGNREDMVLPNGVTTEYTYDSLNRLTNISNLSSSVTLSAFDYNLAADGMREGITEQLRKTDGSGTDTFNKTYQYDNLNRLTFESSYEDNTINGYEATYTYDLVGNRTERVVTAKKEGDSQKTVHTTNYVYDMSGTDRLVRENYSVELVTASGAVDMRKSYPVYVADSGSGTKKVSWLPLPSKLWKPSFYVALAAIPTLLMLPLLGGLLRRNNKHRRLKIKLFLARGLCLMLAFMFLFDPFCLQTWADQSQLYSKLKDRAEEIWGENNHTIHYRYDANGSMTAKITVVTGDDPDTEFIEKVVYEYNLQNRLAKVTDITFSGQDTIKDIAEYTYNDEGIRVKSYTYYTVNDGAKQDEKTTTYLIDSYNHTRYAQVLEEWTGGADPSVTYTIGDDVIAKAASSVVNYLLYDGHGSVRQHADSSGDVINYEYDPDGPGGNDPVDYNAFDYDGYGKALTPLPTDTGLYYTGEKYDSSADMYYLRARYYDQNNGRFNRVDPFVGMQDPRSLHKYLYAHCNPINNIDPSGYASLGEMLCVSIIVGSFSAYIAGKVVSIRGGTEQQIRDAQWRWFWIGFGVTAFVYASVWAIHSLWVFLTSGGVVTAQEAAKRGFNTHNELVREWRNLGASGTIHHFVQQTAENINRFGARAIHSIANSVPISNSWHRMIHRFTQSSPANLNLDPAGYNNVNHMWQYIQTLSWEQQYRWGFALYQYVVENGTLQGFNPVNYGL